MDNPNCDGAGPHTAPTVKMYPLGAGGNAILCLFCWAAENRYHYERGKEMDGWPQEDWYRTPEYGGASK